MQDSDDIMTLQNKEWVISKEIARLVPKKEWELIQKIEAYAIENLDSPSHGFDHTQRVYHLAYQIGKYEEADLLVLLAAALLHDIGRTIEEGIGADHAETAAYFGKDFLKTIDFPREKLKPVFNAIAQHRASGGEKPQSVEAKVLSDADNLDALSAIGIGRTFTYGGRLNRDVRGTVRFIRDNMLNRTEKMYTDTARRIAERRINYMIRFLQRIEDEVAGVQ
ncbi:MAG: HD domain-containing protein [archaeon]